MLLLAILFQIILHVTSRGTTDLNTALSTSEGFKILGDTNEGIGFSVSSAGDINKDGIDDIIFGAPYGGPTARGIIYVVYGKPSGLVGYTDLHTAMPLSQGFHILPPATVAGQYLGYSVSRAGDFNKDGVDDIIVADPNADSSFTDSGTVYVIYGQAGGFSGHINLGGGLTVSQGLIIYGKMAASKCGFSVSYAGDFNDDGVDDVIIGAYMTDSPSLTTVGEAYVIYGKAGGFSAHLTISNAMSTSVGLIISGGASGDKFGNTVSTAGDVNKDGIADVIIGANNVHRSGSIQAGAAYVVYGRHGGYSSHINIAISFPISQGFRVLGSTLSSELGSGASAAGDVNNDGIDDIMIGDPFYTPSGRTNAGAVFIIFGVAGGLTSNIDLNAGLTISQGVTITGNLAGDGLGCFVSSAGDFNHDGVDDIILGAKSATRLSRAGAGSAYLLYGKPAGFTANIDLSLTLATANGFEIIGGVAGEQLGDSVAYISDMNHDGVNDIILGGYLANIPGRPADGAVYVIYADTPTCPTQGCISCTGSTCLACQVNHLLYLGDGKCYFKDSCPAGTVSNSTHCVVPAPSSSDDKVIETISTTTNWISKIAVIVTFAISLVSFNNPLALLFSALADILMYLKYLKVNYPPKLQYLLEQPEFSLLSITYISAPPDQMVENMPSFSIPDNFENHDVDSSFLINFWSSFPLLLCALIAIGVLYLVKLIANNCKLTKSKLDKFRQALEWNYIFGIFIGFYGPVGFYSYFEFRTAEFESSLKIVSFIICVLMNIALIFISVKMFLITRTLAKEKNLKKHETLKQRFSKYEIAFESFKSTSFSQQSYLLFDCLRFYFFNMVLAYLFEYPLVQALLINIQGFISLGYLCIKKPFQETSEFVQILIAESILQVIHICVLGLVITDSKEASTGDDAVRLGYVVIGCICLFIAVQCVCLLIQIVEVAQTVYKFLKNLCEPKPKSSTLSKVKSSRSLQKDLSIDQTMVSEVHDLMRSHSPEKNDTTILQSDPAIAPKISKAQASKSQAKSSPKRNYPIRPMKPAAVARKPKTKASMSPTNYESRSRYIVDKAARQPPEKSDMLRSSPPTAVPLRAGMEASIYMANNPSKSQYHVNPMLGVIKLVKENGEIAYTSSFLPANLDR